MLRYALFDLDNTLYSEVYGLEREVLRRMTAFSARFLDLPLEEAVALRHARMSHFGTTLEWLMKEHGLTDVEGYFAEIHPAGEEEPLSPDPDLGRVLDSIELPKAVYTNAPMDHAIRILDRLGLSAHFDAIYDIRFNALRGKPHRDANLRVCAACGVEPAECLFVDDVPRYVHGFIESGGKGYLIDEGDRHAESSLPRIHSLLELPRLIAEERRGGLQPGLF